MLNVGSMFSGAGLLDCGLQQAGLRHAWLCEREPDRRALLAKRWPGALILDDVRAVGRDTVPRVDVIAGGFPCKGVSTAGKREGFGHPETVLWREMFRAVRELRPRYVLVENVAALLSAGGGAVWGEVLGDLASLGMSCVWDCIPAGSVGAPHLRDRVFAVATHTDGTGRRECGGREPRASELPASERARADASDAGGWGWPGEGRRRPLEPDERAATGDHQGRTAAPADPGSDGVREQPEPERGSGGPAVAAEPGEAAADTEHATRDGLVVSAPDRLPGRSDGPGDRGVAVEWGVYEPAIRRWEAVHGPAPAPLVSGFRGLDDGRADVQRVRARMDRQRLSALGDGVHVYVGRIVGEYIAGLERDRLRRVA